MSKVFRWLGPGVLTDRVGGKSTVHQGRREGSDGKLIEGEIVREHTVAPEKLEAWVKAGMAEYVNLAERALDSIKGGKQDEDSKDQGKQLQATQNQADAAARLQALAKLRRTLSGPLFDDEDRKAAEEKFMQVEPARYPDFLAAVEAERKKRQDVGGKRGNGKKDELPAEGAGPKGDGK